jgi:hypothetical protein
MGRPHHSSQDLASADLLILISYCGLRRKTDDYQYNQHGILLLTIPRILTLKLARPARIHRAWAAETGQKANPAMRLVKPELEISLD